MSGNLLPCPEMGERSLDQEKNLFESHLLAVGKLEYAKGTRPNVACIFCAVIENHPQVTSLKVYEEQDLFICLNLYPYNPGHLMIIPRRHVEKFEELTVVERNRMFEVTMMCQKMLSALFSPSGFNVGYNQGDYSGASIKHIHIHIVPRYRTELGYIDIIGGTKIVVEPISVVFELIKNQISDFINPVRTPTKN